MFEMIVVFAALTSPVPFATHPRDDIKDRATTAAVVTSSGSGQHSLSSPTSAATIASHSASNGPAAGARLARAYQ